MLDPETWIGKPFPLLKHIDRQDDLNAGDSLSRSFSLLGRIAHGEGEGIGSGRWKVVLYRDGCDVCEQLIPRYIGILGDDGYVEKHRVAFVALSSPGHGGRAGYGGIQPVVWAHLRQDREWFARAPIEITVDYGIVRGVRNGAELQAEFGIQRGHTRGQEQYCSARYLRQEIFSALARSLRPASQHP